VQFIVRSPDVFFWLMAIWSQAVVAMSLLLSTFFSRVLVSYLVTSVLILALVNMSFLLNQEMLNPLDSMPRPLFSSHRSATTAASTCSSSGRTHSSTSTAR